MNRRTRTLLAALLALVLAAGLAACGDSDDDASGSSDSDAAAESSADKYTGGDAATEVRLGYFPNVTHAPAIYGVDKGLFQEALGDVKLTPATFNAGPQATEALFADAIDATYIGPNPAINAFAKSNGEAIRIIGGTTSGGAFLVTKPDITDAQDLKGKKIATPQLGNTQDVALRAWLKDEGLSADAQGGGDVSIVPQENAQTLETFKTDDIQGAWVPEPWATRLIQEGGGKVLVDEADLWPEGRYVTTHLIVRTKFLDENPGIVKKLLEAHIKSVDAVNDDPTAAQTVVNAGIGTLTGKPLKPETITAAWENLTFTVDPIATSLRKSAKDAESVGLLEPVDLEGIYDLTLLNEILLENKKEPVKD